MIRFIVRYAFWRANYWRSILDILWHHEQMKIEPFLYVRSYPLV